MDHQKKYLVALSGGADSVALLMVLHELGYQLEGVHCNFHLRGEESDKDEDFCKNLCERYGITLHIAHFATKEYAEDHKISIEMAARHLRYDYFEKLRKDVGAEAVAVAHHKDDSAETILLNLIRGTGIHGLTGISPRRGCIIRPLLGVGRREIEDFLQSRNQAYVTDSSNLIDDVARNKIRLHVLPAMREVNPSVTDSILTTANRLKDALEIFEKAMNDKVENAILPSTIPDRKIYSIDKIEDEYTLFYILRPFGFSPSLIGDIFSQLSTLHSGAFFISTTHELLVDRRELIVQPVQDHSILFRFPIEGKYVINKQRSLRISLVENNEDFSLCRDNLHACLDASTISFPLILRNVRQGDRFQPLGMKGSRLVSDFLTDLKVNLLDKRSQWILADSKERIVWVVGHRISDHCRVTDMTRKIVIIELLSSTSV